VFLVFDYVVAEGEVNKEEDYVDEVHEGYGGETEEEHSE
jgi:hypothetical protein